MLYTGLFRLPHVSRRAPRPPTSGTQPGLGHRVLFMVAVAALAWPALGAHAEGWAVHPPTGTLDTGGGAEECSAVFTFTFGTPGLRTLSAPPLWASAVSYKTTGRPTNFGATEVTVRDGDNRVVYESERTWLAGFSQERQESVPHNAGGTWKVQFDSDPIVIYESGNLDFQVCWE